MYKRQGYSAFKGCSDLTSIELPEGITSIGTSAFDGCSGLISITLPEGLTSIGYSAFKGCSDLTSIELPAGITSIKNETFYGCSALTDIILPERLASIGSYIDVYKRQVYGCFGGVGKSGHRLSVVKQRQRFVRQTYAAENDIPFSTDPMPQG